jgi:hypothetical protein
MVGPACHHNSWCVVTKDATVQSSSIVYACVANGLPCESLPAGYAAKEVRSWS